MKKIQKKLYEYLINVCKSVRDSGFVLIDINFPFDFLG